VKKSAVRDEILLQLRAELNRQVQAAQTSRDEAISEESRPENKYDTHSQEAAYLAEGQARLVAEIAESIKLYESLPVTELSTESPIALGALVALEHVGKRSWYFVGPRSGGLEVRIDETEVLVVTPQSPLGRELMGKQVGDTVRPPNSKAASLQTVAVVR
jgi:transcription elongation GreA/GreB family factor